MAEFAIAYKLCLLCIMEEPFFVDPEYGLLSHLAHGTIFFGKSLANPDLVAKAHSATAALLISLAKILPPIWT